MSLQDSSTFKPLRCTQNLVQKYRNDSFFCFCLLIVPISHGLSLKFEVFFHTAVKETAQLLFQGLKISISGQRVRRVSSRALAQYKPFIEYESVARNMEISCHFTLKYTVEKGSRVSRLQPGCHEPKSPWAGIIQL
jgi:hypothetical protein